MQVNPATVRRWIRLYGLDAAIVTQSLPIILQGSKVKAWMKARQIAKKQPCASNEIYCVGCKNPRQIAPESFHIVQRNAAKLTLKGNCVTCGLVLHRFGSVANRATLEAQFGPKPPDIPAA